MTYHKCVVALAIAATAVTFCSAQQFQDFADYDYADPFQQQQVFDDRPPPPSPPLRRQPDPPSRSQPPLRQSSAGRRPDPSSGPIRGQIPPQRPGDSPRDRDSDRERTTAKPVAILEQINEHNEDGSYTYGYKAEDGSFKLETRHPDGRVTGKYGYLDINTGDLRIIEYGADAMGFQPAGDLPEGIIVPPPVNGTDEDYADYIDSQQDSFRSGGPVQANASPDFDNNPDQNSRIRISANRARGGSAGTQGSRRPPPPPSQNRGQDIAAPVTERSRTRFSQQDTIPQQQQQEQRFPPPQQDQQRFANFQQGQQQEQQPARFDPQQVRQTIQEQRSQQQVQQRPTATPSPPNFSGPDFQTDFDQAPRQQFQQQQQQSARPTPPQQQPPREQQSSRFQNFGSQGGQTRLSEQPRSLGSSTPVRQNSVNRSRGRGRRPVSRGRTQEPTSAPALSTSQDQTSQQRRRPASQRTRARPTNATPSLASLRGTPSSPSGKPTTEDPLEVLRSLQQGGGRPTSAAPTRSRPTAPQRSQPSSALDAVRGGSASPRPTSTGSQFSSFPSRSTSAGAPSRAPQRSQQQQQSLSAVRGVAASTPSRRPPSPVRGQQSSSSFSSFPVRSGSSSPPAAPPTPRRPLTPTPAAPIRQQPTAQPDFSQPIRIRTRPVAAEPVAAQPPARLPAFVPTPAPVSGNSARFLPRPAVPASPAPATSFSPAAPGQQSVVDFDQLISEFTGRQTPRPTASQFAAFNPRTPASPVAQPATPSVPAFAPTPAVPSFNFQAAPQGASQPGGSFQLVIGS